MSKHKTLTIPYELWEWLRARAFNEKKSMVEVLRGMREKENLRLIGDGLVRDCSTESIFCGGIYKESKQE